MVSNKGELSNSLLVSQKKTCERNVAKREKHEGWLSRAEGRTNDFQMSTYTYNFTYTFSYVNILY